MIPSVAGFAFVFIVKIDVNTGFFNGNSPNGFATARAKLKIGDFTDDVMDVAAASANASNPAHIAVIVVEMGTHFDGAGFGDIAVFNRAHDVASDNAANRSATDFDVFKTGVADDSGASNDLE